jgi:cell division protein ZapA (FtsZ GTPase activity inhibitor)
LEHFVTIELFGQPYTFKSDAEASKAKEVADLLVQEVAKIQEQQGGPSAHIPKLTILILAALNISNRIVQLKNDYGEFAEKMAERSDRLNRMLDEGLNLSQPLRFPV